MRTRTAGLTILAVVVGALMASAQDQDVKAIIENIKNTSYGHEFLQTHSEENLEKVILFCRDPIRYFPDVKNLHDFFGYVEAILLGSDSGKAAFFNLLKPLRAMDDRTLPILIFLMEGADGLYAESLNDHFSAWFVRHPDGMIKALEKANNWRRVVDLLQVASWPEFRSGELKLGNSDLAVSVRQYCWLQASGPRLPERVVWRSYLEAASKNVLAAVNAKVFFGYWSVCADGQGFGYGYTYPSLDGHQMTDALLWLGQVDVVKANWDYVRSFQRPDGSLPIAILPDLAGKHAGEGDHLAPVAANGGLYAHWIPGNPLQALADPTYIQNADDIFRMSLDRKWLEVQLPSVNLSADHLASLVTNDGRVRGAGYYVEMPARIESDGVAQCHAVDAFRRVAALNRVVDDEAKAKRYEALAERVRAFFVTKFWVEGRGQFAEYWHPEKGFISSHGLTDVDWAAIALDVATPEQVSVLWPKLKDEEAFHYGGMPTGIATRPETYEDWEFTHPRRHDVAAMGRVWYLEAQARAHMGDSYGLLRSLKKVAEVGRANDYYWRERYQPDGKGGVVVAGPNTYCEYPANFIRIVKRFLLGVELNLDGSVLISPTVTRDWWLRGFGQTLNWRGRTLEYEMKANRITGTYHGPDPQVLRVWLPGLSEDDKIEATIEFQAAEAKLEHGLISIILPAATLSESGGFEIVRKPAK